MTSSRWHLSLLLPYSVRTWLAGGKRIMLSNAHTKRLDNLCAVFVHLFCFRGQPQNDKHKNVLLYHCEVVSIWIMIFFCWKMHAPSFCINMSQVAVIKSDKLSTYFCFGCLLCIYPFRCKLLYGGGGCLPLSGMKENGKNINKEHNFVHLKHILGDSLQTLHIPCNPVLYVFCVGWVLWPNWAPHLHGPWSGKGSGVPTTKGLAPA